MISELQGYIAACESNIQTYKEMGDDRAVDAAQGMIEKFEIYLQQLESAMEYENSGFRTRHNELLECL